MTFRAKITKSHDDQAQVNFRNKTERSLLGLLDTCDTIALDAYNQNKKMSDIEEELDKEMNRFYTGFIHTNSELTASETEFINEQMKKLDEVLKKRGDTHISDLKKLTKFNFLRSEGGEGYTLRHLPSYWGKMPSAFTSDSPIAELQDRVFGLTLQTSSISENQQVIASAIDSLKDQIDKLDQRIFAVAYADGERILKCF